ncbi:hypothetical protein N3K66_006285 [Trichothecium roseum]|uniref:Uncharacterized protein n=1 Tax=Trichothecium roseum TaxID=47278 RepID=A0ACC0V1N8_9HYPO|nr:hypothetical protein N3K66_006285 [Trichothecium roseum]
MAFSENGMAPDVAYSMIRNHLSADAIPSRNLGSFVTTQLEEKAEKLMIESLSKNIINHESYPATQDIQNRCVEIIAGLFNAPIQGSSNSAVGTSTVGSSEAILLATLAMKKHWVQKHKREGKDYSNPNMIMSSAVQVCWKKAALYFDIEERYAYCSEDRYIIDPVEAVSLVDENTIGICAILGTTYTGEYEDVEAINNLLVEQNIDVPIHVDAASGGFVTPFLSPDLRWDFRLERVASINVSGHKYGLVYAGTGWAIWRSAEYLPQELIFSHHYLGTEQNSLTLNFSRGSSHIISQYYRLICLGRNGYRQVMLNLASTAGYLASQLEVMGCFVVMSKRIGNGLPLVTFRLDPNQSFTFDEFKFVQELQRQGGWVVPAYTMAPRGENVKIIRVVVREDLSRPLCDILVSDMRLVLQRFS